MCTHMCIHARARAHVAGKKAVEPFAQIMRAGYIANACLHACSYARASLRARMHAC